MTDPLYFFLFTTLVFSVAAAIVYLSVKMRTAHDGDPPGVRLEVRRLYFAGGAVAALGLVFLEAMGMYFFSCPPQGCDITKEIPGKKIFEASVQVIPPLITLILGYYFGKTDERAQVELPKPQGEASSVASKESNVA